MSVRVNVNLSVAFLEKMDLIVVYDIDYEKWEEWQKGWNMNHEHLHKEYGLGEICEFTG